MTQSKHYNLEKRKGVIHILAVGPFGKAVVAVFKELLPDVIETQLNPDAPLIPALWPVARINILVSWRPAAQLCRLVEAVSYAWEVPFITTVLESPNLRVGPVVLPGSGACYTCYEKRSLQHSPRPEARVALYNYYDTHPKSGPQGYLIPSAEIAAVRLAQVVTQLDSNPAAVAGEVWQLNTISRLTIRSEVVGIHGCPRCGLQRDEAKRSFETIRKDLSYLFLESQEEALPLSDADCSLQAIPGETILVS